MMGEYTGENGGDMIEDRRNREGQRRPERILVTHDLKQ